MWYNKVKKTCREVVMEYVSVAKMAEKWGLSERSVRNYCAHGRIRDSKLIGKTLNSKTPRLFVEDGVLL